MKKIFVIFVFIASLGLYLSPTFAQNYQTGIGARFGYFNGFTAKHFLNNTNAVEGLLTFRWSGAIITGLYEWQKPVKGANNLDWEIGLGGHIGFVDGNDYWNGYHNNTYTVVGVDFILGLEYTFKEAPFTLGLDWKPALNFTGYYGWWGDGLGISIRYNFK